MWCTPRRSSTGVASCGHLAAKTVLTSRISDRCAPNWRKPPRPTRRRGEKVRGCDPVDLPQPAVVRVSDDATHHRHPPRTVTNQTLGRRHQDPGEHRPEQLSARTAAKDSVAAPETQPARGPLRDPGRGPLRDPGRGPPRDPGRGPPRDPAPEPATGPGPGPTTAPGPGARYGTRDGGKPDRLREGATRSRTRTCRPRPREPRRPRGHRRQRHPRLRRRPASARGPAE